MTNAARVHAVENGKDLAGYSMIAFGGGGPLHAGRLLDKLRLDELIVPPDAGVGSAVGFLRAPFAYEAVRSFYTSTVDFDVDGANRVLTELTDEAMAFVREGTDATSPSSGRSRCGTRVRAGRSRSGSAMPPSTTWLLSSSVPNSRRPTRNFWPSDRRPGHRSGQLVGTGCVGGRCAHTGQVVDERH